MKVQERMGGEELEMTNTGKSCRFVFFYVCEASMMPYSDFTENWPVYLKGCLFLKVHHYIVNSFLY
jgi:predicted NAD-dependent protein-ADP-ribosyltransferase YbiA (DUF1768 family)